MEKNKQILIADDSATMRQLLKMIITKHLTCDVTESPDGLAALEQFRAGAYDLVMTDINMPRLDGLGLIKSLRQEEGSSVPIIVLTTKGGEDDRDRGLALGANAYLTKPVNGTQVIKTVVGLLG